MRPTFLPKSFLVKSVLAATLGCAVLTTYGAQSAAADDAETRFLQMTASITDYCTPVPPTGIDGVSGDASVSESGSGSGSGSEGIDSTQPVSVEEVPLTAVEQCAGDEHAQRIAEAFRGTGASSYEALREKLTALDYPVSRIYSMPDRAGAPRARIDLRVSGGDHLALEVTGFHTMVMVEAFGAPEGVSVTDVRLQLQLDVPTCC
ncbi:hypothetical protein [Streptomyces ipomoeae]|uniref:hypothetical protein n=1 Tax=Streptomyces ipomoeae TaxID=103232 RepID=UPI001147A5B2|nr:hypothetical protein [Streptomyces ipomoeae]MDX2935374.1 hypothetical protein [Streptomyces ipomoeae]TQE19971.1 hypothetical protein SipoB123_30000 [Streptomyces ipomoeae]